MFWNKKYRAWNFHLFPLFSLNLFQFVAKCFEMFQCLDLVIFGSVSTDSLSNLYVSMFQNVSKQYKIGTFSICFNSVLKHVQVRKIETNLLPYTCIFFMFQYFNETNACPGISARGFLQALST